MSNPQEEVYREYANYDWDSFTEFQEGIAQILESHLQTMQEQDPSITSIPALDRQQLIDQAKSFFFCSKTGHIFNLDDYEQWKLHNQVDKKEPKIQEITPEEALTEALTEAPYSSNYQELVELIVAGKPVPGIKEIPDTILPEKSSKPVQQQRTKPWEMAKEAATE